MITTNKNKVLIEFEHPCPKEAVKDLQQAIIKNVQNQNIDEFNFKEIQENNYVLLELLMNLMK